MKKIFGLALGLTMIALTPAVGNAAGMIEITCGKEKPFSINSIGGEQKLFGQANIKVSFGENTIIIKDEAEKTLILDYANGKIFKDGEDLGILCKFKNLAALKQENKPVSTSVQQRLQALEERLDRIESLMKK